MEDRILIDFIQKQTDVTAAIKQRVDDMHHQLFGNGRAGTLQHLETIALSAKEEAAQAAAAGLAAAVQVKAELNDRVMTLESYRKLDRRWLAGALAVLGVEGGALGFYFKYMADKWQPMLQSMKHIVGQ